MPPATGHFRTDNEAEHEKFSFIAPLLHSLLMRQRVGTSSGGAEHCGTSACRYDGNITGILRSGRRRCREEL